MSPLLSIFRQILSGCLALAVGVSLSTPLVYPSTADQIQSAVQTNFSVMGVENSALPPDFRSVMPAVPMSGDPPTANDDGIEVDEDGIATTLVGGASSVLANDIDPETDPLTSTVHTDVSFGVLVLNEDGTFSYDHDGSETTSDSFVYNVDDGTSTVTATVNITITLVNDPPDAINDSITVLEDGVATVLVGGATSVRENDIDPDTTTLTITLDTDVTNGNLTLNEDGTFSYDHNGGETTSDSFVYIADDGEYTDTATVNITISPVNDAPVANGDSIVVSEGGTATKLVGGASSVRANDIDPDSTLEITPGTAVSHGTLTLNQDGTFSYQHDGSETTSDSFTYTASDGEYTDTAEVSIVVTPVNDAPVAEQDSYNALADTRLNVKAPGLLANDSDVEADDLHAILDTDVSRGKLTLNGDGSIAYDPPEDFLGAVQFSYKAFDGALFSNIVTVTITVLERDDEPPSISWISPAIEEDSWIDVGNQIYPLEVDVSDNVEIDVVNFKRWEPSLGEKGDWVYLGSLTAAPFHLDLDTSTLNFGFNQITAEAFDTSGNYSESYIFLRRWGMAYLPAVSR